jgi:hypothetical protein
MNPVLLEEDRLPPASIPKKVLIVSAHFPPSNLVSIHRARLLANHLGEWGWKPIVLSLDPKTYEEAPDPSLMRLVNPETRVLRPQAIPASVSRRFGIGDIALRGWPTMLRAARKAIQTEKIDLLLITIPSYYQALLGPALKFLTGIPYVIDFQDPWVDDRVISCGFFSKARLSRIAASILEPIAVRGAAGISGITPEYFAGVTRRNPGLRSVPSLAFQMGFSRMDHEQINECERNNVRKQLFQDEGRHCVYAGALLPMGREPMKAFLKALALWNRAAPLGEMIYLHCFGTGSNQKDRNSHQVLPMARDTGADRWVRESPIRLPFLEILTILSASDAVIVAGSTEPHYSPSKLFQALLSKKRVLAWLHERSEAAGLMIRAELGALIKMNSEFNESRFIDECLAVFSGFSEIKSGSVPWELLAPFEASQLCRRVATFLNEALVYAVPQTD